MSAPTKENDSKVSFVFSQKAYKAVLEIIENNLKCEDYSIEVSAGSNKGDNYIGIVYRIDVKVKNEMKLSFILKSTPQNAARREEFFVHSAFERELLFYNEIFPVYKKFQEEKGIDLEKEGFNNVAHCYKMLFEKPHETLFFDNLRIEGFDVVNRYDDPTRENVLLAMEALGKFHAVFFSLKDQKPEAIQKFQQIKESSFFSGKIPIVRIMMAARQEDAKAFVKKSENEDLKGKLLNFLDRDLVNEFLEIIEASKAEPYAVICHGDCTSNNIMFQNNLDGTPKDVKLLDFQMMRYSSPVLDLIYYIFNCTTKELRDKHYDEFLDVYYQTLSNFMKRLGSSSDKIFSRAEFNHQLKKFGCFAIPMGVLLIPLYISDPDDTPDFGLIADSYKASQNDRTKKFDASLVEIRSLKTRQKYEERLMGVFEDMVRLEYI